MFVGAQVHRVIFEATVGPGILLYTGRRSNSNHPFTVVSFWLMVSHLHPDDVRAFYGSFAAPITDLDCGQKCSPYNQRGVPFCCDTRHAVPTAYQAEWHHLRTNTDLWHPWEAQDLGETAKLREAAPDGMVLIECLGHHHCQRAYRSITCRAFPFFPYINSLGEFSGLAYYWEYEDRCWVINNLAVVTTDYRQQFVEMYDALFDREPDEWQNFGHQSRLMRQVFAERKRTLPLLHRDGGIYQIMPNDERLQPISPGDLPKFGPYEIADRMPFPDER